MYIRTYIKEKRADKRDRNVSTRCKNAENYVVKFGGLLGNKCNRKSFRNNFIIYKNRETLAHLIYYIII